eukprot:TRINITY_DN72095_c0_g1_i1.p1 TRINITY_DN72095_c0_g1~~TRINITY_DN72095_c0_g1_i1.p1  ORF type:complete len:479 (+),score=83.32 TRINITY_DN72095_c0_g1_i1:68-1438(+)
MVLKSTGTILLQASNSSQGIRSPTKQDEGEDRKTVRRRTLGETIRLAQFGILQRPHEMVDVNSMEMREDVYRNERALPSTVLSFDHLRIRCGVGTAAQGEICVDEAKKWLKKTTQKDMRELASWDDPPDCLQKPVQAALQFLCDDDLSLENCRKSLLSGRAFLRELEQFNHMRVTQKNLEKITALHSSAAAVIAEGRGHNQGRLGLYTALVFAVLINSVIIANRERLGLAAEAEKPTKTLTAVGATFARHEPVRIEFRHLLTALDQARDLEKTPLLVCNGKELVVCCFFEYMCAVAIDAKRVINEVHIKKIKTREEMQEELRQKVSTALRYGRPLHVRMANSAFDWRPYCERVEDPETATGDERRDDSDAAVGSPDGPSLLPHELFQGSAWYREPVWSRVLRARDMEGCCFNMDTHFLFITSDWDLAKVKEHYPDRVPHFEQMAIIDIDVSSLEAD